MTSILTYVLENLNWILAGIFGFTFLNQILYYCCVYFRIPASRKLKNPAPEQPVSVVICARNEAENLEKYLPLILEQDYPDYEVVVVNDCSEDNTEFVLDSFRKKYPHLHTTQINRDEKFTHGKKLALTVGIKATKNELLLLTDADCMPSSKNWIREMVKNFIPGTEIVLGYGGYQKSKGFVNKLVRAEFLFNTMSYMGFAKAGMPYMGVGRNLAYRKSVFFKNRGFASHSGIVSGDDDLFVNENATSKNTRIEFCPDSHTHTPSKKTFSEWIVQKKRHLSTGKHYKFNHKFFLGNELSNRIVFYILFIILMIRFEYRYYVLAIFGIRLILQVLALSLTAKHLKEKGVVVLAIFYDILSPYFNFVINFLNSIGRKNTRWK